MYKHVEPDYFEAEDLSSYKNIQLIDLEVCKDAVDESGDQYTQKIQ